MIGMQISIEYYPGRSSRLAEDGVRSGSGATAPGQSPEQRGGDQKKAISGTANRFT